MMIRMYEYTSILPMGRDMALLVKYKNDGMGYISKYELDELIATGRIDAFMRSNGQWVNPAQDPVRGNRSASAYKGPERRARY